LSWFDDPVHFGPKTIGATVVQPDGKVLILGEYMEGLARLNPDGSRDLAFQQRPFRRLGKLIVQPDGRILVSDGRIGDGTLVRLNSDGSIDPEFPALRGWPGPLQPDGRLLVARAYGQSIARIYLSAEPTPGLRLVNPTVGPDGFTLTLPSTVPGKKYLLESAESVSGPTWTSQMEVDGTGLIQFLSDRSTTNQARQFYRVKVQ
jgi:hypothetical protein